MKAVAQETGLNPITIRTWEQRYGLPRPQRTEGGHRQYTQRDIEIFKWLIACQKKGLSIRHAAETWHSLEAQGQDPLSLAAKPQQKLTSVQLQTTPSNQLDELREQWIAACMAFEREAAEALLTQAFSYFPAEIVCTELLQKGIAQIGEGWYRGDVTVQQEHFATALAVRRLEALVAATSQPLHSERILIFCAPDDYHVFSPLLLTFLLLRRGWDVLYLGANVPTETLNKTVAQIAPKLVIISAQQLRAAANLLDVAKLLQEQNVMIGYGGLIFNYTPDLRQYMPGHFLGESLGIALNQIETLLTMAEAPTLPPTITSSDTYQKALEEFISRRAIIESHVWGTFIANNRSIDHLMQINADFSLTLLAALRLGSMELLGQDSTWINDLLISYRPPQDFIDDYLFAYYQAAKIHLSESANLITDWLHTLVADLDP